MIRYVQARRLADTWVDIVSDGSAIVIEVLPRPYGWIFFWQAKRYLETQDPLDCLVGNAPIIVDRVDAEVRVTGTAQTFESDLREYEATLPPARLSMSPELPSDDLRVAK